MNKTIARIVDIMFQDTEMNEEALALHDEMLQNCDDHYADLLGQGMAEDEAVAQVVESLKGMEEVIAGYPRRQDAPMPEKPHSEEYEEIRFRANASQVRKLCCELRDDDLDVHAYDGDDIRVLYDEDDAEQIETHLDGDTLTITRLKNVPHTGRGWLHLSFSFGSSADITVLVPRDKELTMQARSASGDIQLRNVRMKAVSAETMSGDLTVNLPDGFTAQEVRLRTSSGDLMVQGDTEQMIVNSMSGDLSLDGRAERTEARTVSGDVSLNGEVEELNARSTSGDVTVRERQPSLRKAEITSTSGDAELFLCPDGRTKNIEAHTVSGDVRGCQDNAGPDADIQVHISSISGDVQVR